MSRAAPPACGAPATSARPSIACPRRGPQLPSPLTTDDQHLLLVASPAGIDLSRDAGRTFTRVATTTGIRAIAFDFRNWHLAYAAAAGGRLLRSDDGGSTWEGS